MSFIMMDLQQQKHNPVICQDLINKMFYKIEFKTLALQKIHV